MFLMRNNKANNALAKLKGFFCETPSNRMDEDAEVSHEIRAACRSVPFGCLSEGDVFLREGVKYTKVVTDDFNAAQLWGTCKSEFDGCAPVIPITVRSGRECSLTDVYAERAFEYCKSRPHRSWCDVCVYATTDKLSEDYNVI